MHSDFGPLGQIRYYVISYLCVCVRACVYGVHILLCMPYYIIFCVCYVCDLCASVRYRVVNYLVVIVLCYIVL